MGQKIKITDLVFEIEGYVPESEVRKEANSLIKSIAESVIENLDKSKKDNKNALHYPYAIDYTEGYNDAIEDIMNLFNEIIKQSNKLQT